MVNAMPKLPELTFYDSEYRETLMDDDELSAEEAAFMQGYEDAEDIE